MISNHLHLPPDANYNLFWETGYWRERDEYYQKRVMFGRSYESLMDRV